MDIHPRNPRINRISTSTSSCYFIILISAPDLEAFQHRWRSKTNIQRLIWPFLKPLKKYIDFQVQVMYLRGNTELSVNIFCHCARNKLFWGKLNIVESSWKFRFLTLTSAERFVFSHRFYLICSVKYSHIKMYSWMIPIFVFHRNVIFCRIRRTPTDFNFFVPM